jgi:hypothetical protein
MKQPREEQRHLGRLGIETLTAPECELFPRLVDRGLAMGFRDETQQARGMILHRAAQAPPS